MALSLRSMAAFVAAAVLPVSLLTIGATAPSASAIIAGSNATSANGIAFVTGTGAGYRADCGGTVIHARWVLTARHCWMENMSVRVGSLNRTTGGQVIKVTNRYFPTKSDGTPGGDIMLLKLASAANTRPVPLATKNPEPWTRAEIYGWGDTKCYTCESPSILLKRASVFVVDLPANGDHYRGSAIKTAQDTGRGCMNDSGGPLFKWHNGGRYVTGVFSHVGTDEQGAQECWYGWYASVPAHRIWIRSITGF